MVFYSFVSLRSTCVSELRQFRCILRTFRPQGRNNLPLFQLFFCFCRVCRVLSTGCTILQNFGQNPMVAGLWHRVIIYMCSQLVKASKSPECRRHLYMDLLRDSRKYGVFGRRFAVSPPKIHCNTVCDAGRWRGEEASAD